MTESAPHTDPALCWQCGAPADPDCAFIQKLSAPSRHLRDNAGYPVVRGRRYDSLRLPIPRCARRRMRNGVTTGLCILGFFRGGVIGNALFPASQWIWPVGAFGGLGLFILAWRLYLQATHLRSTQSYPPLRRSTQSYPPLRRLRAAGPIPIERGGRAKRKRPSCANRRAAWSR
jgi:hypothetical protein